MTKKLLGKVDCRTCLRGGDAVMADKGFVIRYLLTFKKVHLVSPAYCKGTINTSRVRSLRTHVSKKNILKLKHCRILSGVILLLLKTMLGGIIFVCAALTNLCQRSIK